MPGRLIGLGLQPFIRAVKIGGDDDGGALVEAADQMEEQLAAGLSERQIAELVQYDEVQAGQIIGKSPLSAAASFALQPIDEVNDSVEAASRAAADGGSRDGYGEMRLTSAGSGSADQHGVALLGEEGPTRQLADQRLVDSRPGEVEVVDVLGQRHLGDRQLVLDRARPTLGSGGTFELCGLAARR